VRFERRCRQGINRPLFLDPATVASPAMDLRRRQPQLHAQHKASVHSTHCNHVRRHDVSCITCRYTVNSSSYTGACINWPSTISILSILHLHDKSLFNENFAPYIVSSLAEESSMHRPRRQRRSAAALICMAPLHATKVTAQFHCSSRTTYHIGPR
jgi:hypothetical protein